MSRLSLGIFAGLFALTSILGGRAYVFCAPMGEARAHCCCPSDEEPGPALRVHCCDDHVTPSLPSAEHDPRGAPAALVLAPVAQIGAPALRAVARHSPGRRSIGARAGPRLHTLHSVFLL